MAGCVQNSTDELEYNELDIKSEGMQSSAKSHQFYVGTLTIKEEPDEQNMHSTMENKLFFNTEDITSSFRKISNVDLKEYQSVREITTVLTEQKIGNEAEENETCDTKPVIVKGLIPDGQLTGYTITEDAFGSLPVKQDKACVSTHQSETSYNCSLCGDSFRSLSSLEQHLLMHCDSKPVACTEQDTSCSQGVDTETKMLSGDLVNADTDLDKSCHQRSNFETIHSGEKVFVCTFCYKTFSSKDGLKKHLLFHSGAKLYACTFCDKSFTQKCSLKTHMLIHFGEKPHACSVCNKSFYEKSILNRHMITHSGKKIFRCTVCDKSFSRNDNLKAHALVHSGEKPFSCTVCDKSFSQNSTLKKHALVHSGEKPFTCTVCDKSFTQKGTLNMHMLIHSGEKPFACTVCDKSFTLKSSLDTHALAHSGEKPYVCAICDKSFNTKCHLRLHMFVHADKKRYACTVCDISFTRKKRLKTHMLVHSQQND